MADFPPLLASSVFDLLKHDVPQIKSHTMRQELMNLINTTLLKKICGPIIENEHLWVCTKIHVSTYPYVHEETNKMQFELEIKLYNCSYSSQATLKAN